MRRWVARAHGTALARLTSARCAQVRIFESNSFRSVHAMPLAMELLLLLSGRQHDLARDDALCVLYALVRHDLDAFANEVLPRFVANVAAESEQTQMLLANTCNALAADEPTFVDAVELFCDDIDGLKDG